MSERTSLVLFVASIILLAFCYGFAAGWKQVPPGKALASVYTAGQDLAKHWKNDLGIEPTRLLVRAHPDRPRDARFIVHDRERMAPGLRVVAGLTWKRPTIYGVLLYDRDGHELHYWPINYREINPGGPDPENTFPQGLAVFEDGSIILNLDNGWVLAKIDACGRVLWTRPGEYHHVVSRAYDGTVWTWLSTNILQIDPDTGRELRRISLWDDIIARHGYQGIFGLQNRPAEEEYRLGDDPYHANDVDVLSPELARAFPQFRAGDLLVSFRSLNLVAVIDHQDYSMKWWSIGPWHRQHDPDFMPDGTISVYNNNMGLGSSQIMRINPRTGDYRVVIAGSEKLPFYSWQRGKHYNLDNGNILVTEPEKGRSFEVDARGGLVWEFQNVFDESRNGLVTHVALLPEGYFKPGALECAGSGSA